MDTLFKQAIKPLFTLLCSVLLFSCGGSGEDSTTKKEITPLPPSIAQTLTLEQQEYRLVSFTDTNSSAIQAYWPSDSIMPDELVNSLKVALPKIIQLFNQQHFAFANAYATEQQGHYKKVLFTPISQSSETTALSFTLSADNLAVVTFDVDEVPDADALTQPLIALIYQSERAKYQEDNGLIGRLVRLGLSLHFAEKTLAADKFVSPNVMTEEVLSDALGQVKQAINEQALLVDWFSASTTSEQGLAASIGYYLVKEHFSFYLGSDASNSFSVDSALFLPWLDGRDNSVKKQLHYVRTGDVSDQIEVGELSRQAHAFIGSYFLEGYNQQKLIALTFDDGPSEYTSKILDVLELAQVPASFFWQGKDLANYAEVIERSISAGHTVANHSWNHANGMDYSPNELWQQQVVKTNEAFQSIVNITPRFYRPPYGEISDEQVQFLTDQGMKVILWSVDSRDWNPELNSVGQIESEIINNHHTEMISLMHDAGGNRQNTVDALAEIIKYYQGQGYHFVNLETMLGISDKQ